MAACSADAAGSRLVLQRRRQLNTTTGAGWELFPDDIVGAVLRLQEPADTLRDTLDGHKMAGAFVVVGPPAAPGEHGDFFKGIISRARCVVGLLS